VVHLKSITLKIHENFQINHFTYKYHIAGKFGESQVIYQTKTIKISTYKYNLLAKSIHLPNFFSQMLKMSKFAKLYAHQTFLLYGID